MLLELLNIEAGALSNGEGRGDGVESEEEDDDVDDEGDDEEEAEEEEEESWRTITVPSTCTPASGSRSTRSNCRVKRVTVLVGLLVAFPSSYTRGGSGSTLAVHGGIVGEEAGAAVRSTVAGRGPSSGCCCWWCWWWASALPPAMNKVKRPARSDMGVDDGRLCDADEDEETGSSDRRRGRRRRRLRQQRVVRVEHWQLGDAVSLIVEKCETRLAMTFRGPMPLMFLLYSVAGSLSNYTSRTDTAPTIGSLNSNVRGQCCFCWELLVNVAHRLGRCRGKRRETAPVRVRKMN